MQMADFTKEQTLAITTLDRNVSVSAGAGSGKTRVLVERFLTILKDPDKSANRILAITFTRKAAREMRERIRKSLLEEVGKTSGELRAHFEEQLRHLDGAPITTIDGFCSQILRDHPVEAGMDPQFTVKEEYEVKEFQASVIDAFLRDLLKKEDEDLELLLGLYHPGRLGSMLYGLLEILPDLMALGDLSSPYVVRQEDWEEAKIRAEETFLAMLASGADLKPSKTKDALLELENARAIYHEALVADDLETVLPFMNLIRAAGKAAPLIKEWKEALIKLQGYARNEVAIPYAKAWNGLLHRLADRLEEESLRQEIFSFSFLAGRAVSLLRNYPEICRAYQHRFDYIMVDEFQDTNEQQKELVYLLSGATASELRGKNLFIVGDAKQSIYRFRGANVTVFRVVRDDIIHSGGTDIVMADNFRSAPEIIESCNCLFRDLLGTDPQKAVMAQDLVPHQKATQKPILAIIDQEDGTFADAQRAEAQWVAQKIDAIVKSHEELGYGDIAILVPAIRLAEPYAAALAEAHIPYTMTDGKGFYEQQEVIDIITIMTAVLSPDVDWAMAGVLRSPYGGLTDQEILGLLRMYPQKNLWESLSQSIEPSHGSLWKKLTVLMHVSRLGSLPELFDAIMETLHVESLLLAMPHGREKMANVWKLRSMAASFAMQEGGGSEDFLDRLNLMRRMQARESGAALEPDAKSVQIMTIHKSKGLEFPAVFLPDQQYKSPPDRLGLQYLPGAGLGIMIPGDEGPQKTALYEELSEDNRALEWEEKKRQLYVAMTRAEKYLFLSAAVSEEKESVRREKRAKGRVKSRENWYESLRRIFHDGEGKDLVEWVELKASEILALPLSFSIQEAPPLELEAGAFEKLKAVEFPQKVILSATALGTYDLCPRRYFYQYRSHMPSLDPDVVGTGSVRIPPATLGTYIHKVLELCRTAPAEKAKELALLEESYSDGEKNVLRKEGGPLIDAYLASPLYAAYGDFPQDAEVDFELPLMTVGNASVYFEGSIDKVVHLPDGTLEIIDYKSGHPPLDGMERKAYSRQLAIYSLAAEALYHMKVSQASLHFLRNLSTWELTDRDREAAELKALLTKLQTLGEEEDFAVKTDACTYCGYGYFCKK